MIAWRKINEAERNSADEGHVAFELRVRGVKYTLGGGGAKLKKINFGVQPIKILPDR